MRPRLFNNARVLRNSLTDPEKLLWRQIRGNRFGYRFNRQFVFDDRYIVDFYCFEKNLVIELDGSQHCNNPIDKERDDYLKLRGCIVLRFWNNEIMKNMDGCLIRIKEYLENEAD